jgi:hypothetical protein
VFFEGLPFVPTSFQEIAFSTYVPIFRAFLDKQIPVDKFPTALQRARVVAYVNKWIEESSDSFWKKYKSVEVLTSRFKSLATNEYDLRLLSVLGFLTRIKKATTFSAPSGLLSGGILTNC